MNQLCKPIQELVLNGEELPASYFHKGGVPGLQDAGIPLGVPVIDIGLLAKGSCQELDKLRSALSSWGCFMAINHGMETAFLDKMRLIMKQFFQLPMEEKRKYSGGVDDLEGYGTETAQSEDQVLDWNDKLYVIIQPEDRRQLKYWPESPQNFMETLIEYTAKVHLIVEVTLKAMAKSLNLKESCFLEKLGDKAELHARFNFYPPCPRPDLVLGVKPHSDGSAMTVLLQDEEVEGLQLLKDDQWFRVPVLPHALLINLGDVLEITVNGVLKSVVHRVVTNSERERISLAVFCSPNLDEDIEPVDALVSDTRPRLYKTVKNYPAIYYHYFYSGKRPIDVVKIQHS